MKKNFKKSTSYIALCLISLLLFISCENQESLTNVKPSLKKKNLNMKIVNWDHWQEYHGEIASKIPLVRLKNKSSNNNESSIYGFYIEEDKVQIIEEDNYTTYTFAVKRENYQSQILENYMYKEFNDGTYKQFLLTYYYITDEDGNTILDLLSMDVEPIYDNGLIPNKTTSGSGECHPHFVEVYQGLQCTFRANCTGYWDHEIGDGACGCDGTNGCYPAGETCEAQFSYEFNDCSGGNAGNVDNPNDPNNPPTGGGGSDNGSGNEDNTTSSVPIEIDNVRDIIGCLGVDESGSSGNNGLSQDQLDWINSSNNRTLAPIRDFLNGESCSPESQDYIIEVIEMLRIGEYPSFEFIQNNRTELDDYTTGDMDNNVEGGEDNTQYPFFDPSQQTWPEIQPIIDEADFIGWGHEGIAENCIAYAKAQIAVSGYQISNYWNNSGQTIQVYKESTGVNMANVAAGISYLKNALENEIPVIVGIDANEGSPNPNTDNTTDHFVVIVGMGEDTSGKYFLFYDNATNNEPHSQWGASSENKLYYNATTGKIIGSSQCDYYDRADYEYLVTQIRKSKPL